MGLNFELTLAPPPWCLRAKMFVVWNRNFSSRSFARCLKLLKLPHLIISPSTQTVNGIPNLVPVLILKKTAIPIPVWLPIPNPISKNAGSAFTNYNQNWHKQPTTRTKLEWNYRRRSCYGVFWIWDFWGQ